MENEKESTLEKELDKVSEPEPSSEKASEEETKPPEDTKPDFKESDEFKEAVTKAAQSMKDTELQDIYAEIKSYKEKNADLTRQVQTREDSRTLSLILDKETAEMGEDEAQKRQEVWRKALLKVRDTEEKESGLTMREKDVEKKEKDLDNAAKLMEAREDALRLLFPKDKDTLSRINVIVEKLTSAETKREYDLLLAGIEKEMSIKKFTPDSGRSTGGGLPIPKDPDEMIKRGLKEKKK